MQNWEQSAAAVQWSDNYGVVYHFAYDVGAQEVWTMSDSFLKRLYTEINRHSFGVIKQSFDKQ